GRVTIVSRSGRSTAAAGRRHRKPRHGAKPLRRGLERTGVIGPVGAVEDNVTRTMTSSEMPRPPTTSALLVIWAPARPTILRRRTSRQLVSGRANDLSCSLPTLVRRSATRRGRSLAHAHSFGYYARHP